MFGRVILVVIVGVVAALLGAFSLLERLPARAPVALAPAPAAVAADAPAPAPEPQPSGYREAFLKADGRGQYAAGVLVNGLPVNMLVDTGASDVFVSASTAARLGLAPSGARRRAIRTANGDSTATPTVLNHVSLGGLFMSDVEALILTPEAGEVNLLGESFLKRLISVEQRGDMLILRQ
ncbi:MAG TPA: TIGR02281 family clan AA aspartic protease [Roseiarcus sp.]|nr:TIGR02281 family clan AA aspartic protease [Roseiarcus sp.]